MILRLLPVFILLLSACATRELPPISVYTLQIGTNPPSAANPANHRSQKPILTMGNIRGSRPFATTQMLYTKSGLDQNSFAYSRWSDAPIALLQQLFSEKLSRSGLFHGVLPSGTIVQSHLVLAGNLLDFSLHTDTDQPVGTLEIRFLLLDKRHGQHLYSHLFRVSVPVKEPSPANTAAALEQASLQVANQLITWLKLQL